MPHCISKFWVASLLNIFGHVVKSYTLLISLCQLIKFLKVDNPSEVSFRLDFSGVAPPNTFVLTNTNEAVLLRDNTTLMRFTLIANASERVDVLTIDTNMYLRSDPWKASAVAIKIWSHLNPLGHVRAWISLRM